MVEQLLNHIQRHDLCKTTDKILLAVSGGMDSMVMFHLFREAGFTIGVAHCNFQLRGADSEADEALVKITCREHAVPFHARRFDTMEYAQARGLSTQMAARELRYNYFNELAAELGYNAVATAHHLNDSLETVLLNFAKGTGIDGLTGVPVKNEKVIRPMLFATREAISVYAEVHQLKWRQDKSNASEDYQRNFIRHRVIPELNVINPNMAETFRATQERLQGTAHMLNFFIDEFAKRAITFSADTAKIDIHKLKELPSPSVVLWELLKEKGFNYSQCKEIVNDHQPGKKFLSHTHKLSVDRHFLFLQRKDDRSPLSLNIDSFTPNVHTPLGSLHFNLVARPKFQLRKDAGCAQLDRQKIKYPLLWRRWKEGDSFVPFGMNHSRKLSDFLIDIKIPLPEKENITVIESAGTIVWVVGYRIHEHFKVTPETQEILTVDFRRQLS